MSKQKGAPVYSAIFACLIIAAGWWFADIGDYTLNVISLAGYGFMFLGLTLLVDNIRRLISNSMST